MSETKTWVIHQKLELIALIKKILAERKNNKENRVEEESVPNPQKGEEK